MSYYDIPSTRSRATPVWQRFMHENAAIAAGNTSGRRRPMPPRSPIMQSQSLGTLITWNAPQQFSTITGFKIYKNTEGNLIQTISDRFTRQILIPLPNTAAAFYISSYNALQESVKVKVVGIGAGTGSLPSVPPGYPTEPSGGFNYSRYLVGIPIL